MNRIIVLAIALIGFAVPLSAQSTQPDSPRATAAALSLAMQQGDTITILFLMQADTPRQQRMIQALADMAGAMANLRTQAVATFGAESAKELIGDTTAGWAQEARRLQDSKEMIEAQTATLTAPDGKVTTLRRVDGRWKVPVGQLAQGRDDAAIDAILSVLELRARIFRDLIGELAAGKYKTADAAAQTLRVKMLNPESDKPHPATQP